MTVNSMNFMNAAGCASVSDGRITIHPINIPSNEDIELIAKSIGIDVDPNAKPEAFEGWKFCVAAYFNAMVDKCIYGINALDTYGSSVSVVFIINRLPFNEEASKEDKCNELFEFIKLLAMQKRMEGYDVFLGLNHEKRGLYVAVTHKGENGSLALGRCPLYFGWKDNILHYGNDAYMAKTFPEYSFVVAKDFKPVEE